MIVDPTYPVHGANLGALMRKRDLKSPRALAEAIKRTDTVSGTSSTGTSASNITQMLQGSNSRLSTLKIIAQDLGVEWEELVDWNAVKPNDAVNLFPGSANDEKATAGEPFVVVSVVLQFSKKEWHEQRRQPFESLTKGLQPGQINDSSFLQVKCLDCQSNT